MERNNAGRFSSSGRTALGGAAAGFTYDAAMLDAVAREERLRRPLRLKRWQGEAARGETPTAAREERTEPELALPSHVN
ncbi:MAG: hypothetical protein ICV73_04415 [Acetobacteraceae bacterium]|nr:hypothetical protein [Acetobacteraceae bacterium]